MTNPPPIRAPPPPSVVLRALFFLFSSFLALFSFLLFFQDLHRDVLAQLGRQQMAVARVSRPNAPHANALGASHVPKRLSRSLSLSLARARLTVALSGLNDACPPTYLPFCRPQIAADAVLIEAVNSALSTKLQCELRLMADGNTLAVRFVGLCMQDSVAGDDPDGGTWTVVARASRHYVRQEVTPLCFGLGGGTETKEGIQKKPSWVY